jgi:hypothetical protein
LLTGARASGVTAGWAVAGLNHRPACGPEAGRRSAGCGALAGTICPRPTAAPWTGTAC